MTKSSREGIIRTYITIIISNILHYAKTMITLNNDGIPISLNEAIG